MENALKKHTLKVKTPEGITFSLQVAGPITRFMAWLIDLITILVMTFAVNSSLRLAGLFSQDLAQAAFIFFYFLISVGYGMALEWRWRGQTIGKRLFGLRVIDVQGLRLQFSQVVIRNLLRVVDKLPACYMIGGLACLISRHGQRLGDIAANTVVIWNKKKPEPDLDQILPDRYNSFRDYPHIEARLRQRISPQEAGIALQALFRRDTFDPQAQVELFRTIASHFKTIAPFPDEATEGISDERYVRNVVDILFRN